MSTFEKKLQTINQHTLRPFQARLVVILESPWTLLVTQSLKTFEVVSAL